MAAFILILVLCVIALAIYLVVAEWKVFEKAGKPGWACIIPFYSGWTLAKIGGRPGWVGLLPSASIVFHQSGDHLSSSDWLTLGIVEALSIALLVYISLGVARNFKKSPGFGVLLGILPFIGFPILAFGSAEYEPQDQ